MLVSSRLGFKESSQRTSQPFTLMIALQLKAELEGIQQLEFVEEFGDWYEFKIQTQCSQCREKHEHPVTFNSHEKVEIQGSRGDANLVIKCKFCSKVGNISVVDLKSYTGGKSVMATFDCRGVDLVEFLPAGSFRAQSEKSKFDVEFDDGEWYDYDEKAGAEVSITASEWTFEKVK